jgi:hypothetical protein
MNDQPIYVYIASPYTKGDVAVNVRNSFLVADELLAHGLCPFPPLYSHFWHFLSPKPYDTWLELDKLWVKACDCLLRMPGESSGADGEVEFAKENDIPVFFSIAELVKRKRSIQLAKSRRLRGISTRAELEILMSDCRD